MLGLTNNDWRGLWAVLWRVLILAPVAWILGLALLVLALAALLGSPFFAIILFLDGHWILGPLVFVGWLAIFRYRAPIMRWLLDGIEYASI
jgi:hypothetical protein